ncbi:MAG TPA: hypothetical protein VKM93_01615 [Terriglobia bacterium]|nr:hypothetical protein [Terriglobia bacterium]
MLWNDLRYGLRLMRRGPGFTVVAVLSLARGIGANTAIFSLFYTVLLHQLPVVHPERLVEFLYKDPGRPRSDGEIGIRMPLGAIAGDVSRLVLGHAMGMLCAGFVVGACMVLWGRPLAASLVLDLKPETSGPVALAGGAIAAVALLASYVPARRAARVDPMVALRHFSFLTSLVPSLILTLPVKLVELPEGGERGNGKFGGRG